MTANFTPRQSAATQWTDLPVEFVKGVQTVFAKQFKDESKTGEFLVEGRIYSGEAILRIGYLEDGRLKQINFEASLDLPKREKAMAESEFQELTMEHLYTGIDSLGSLMEEYFDTDQSEDQMDIGLQWKAFDFEGSEIYLKYSTVNTRLEAEADRILGLFDESLVREELQTEDALEVAEIDSELAHDVQKAIREGKHPKFSTASADSSVDSSADSSEDAHN